MKTWYIQTEDGNEMIEADHFLNRCPTFTEFFDANGDLIAQISNSNIKKIRPATTEDLLRLQGEYWDNNGSSVTISHNLADRKLLKKLYIDLYNAGFMLLSSYRSRELRDEIMALILSGEGHDPVTSSAGDSAPVDPAVSETHVDPSSASR